MIKLYNEEYKITCIKKKEYKITNAKYLNFN